MSFFVRIAGAPTNNDYMAPTTMVYMNDHTWQNALVTQIATNDQLANNDGDGMRLRMYIKLYGSLTGGPLRFLLYTQSYGRGVWVKSWGYAPWIYDTPVFTNTLNQFSVSYVSLTDTYAQEYSINSVAAGYFTLDFSTIMGRQVFKMQETVSPLSAFTFQYEKGTGPVMYNFPYLIKTRPPAAQVAGFATTGHRLKATPEGTLVQSTADDYDQSTHFKFFPLSGVSQPNAYAIVSHFGWYLCITDQGLIETRWAVGPWEQFELSRDWNLIGRFHITKRFDNDPNRTYGFRFSNTDMSVSTWLLGSDDAGPYDSFEIEPVSAGYAN